jgi:hypothetical protein
VDCFHAGSVLGLFDPEDGSDVSESQSHFTSESQSVCLGVEPTLWTFYQILLPYHEFGSGICCPVSGAPSLTRGRVCPL